MTVRVRVGTLEGEDYITVQPKCNVRSLFGPYAILVELPSRTVVPLGDDGLPQDPLKEHDHGYAVLSSLPNPQLDKTDKTARFQKGKNLNQGACANASEERGRTWGAGEEGEGGGEGQGARGEGEGEGGNGDKLRLLEAKLDEYVTWIAALRKENVKMKNQGKAWSASQQQQRQQQQEERHESGNRRHSHDFSASNANVEYGFQGSVQRPKDVALEGVEAAAPGLISTVEGGGKIWEGQPTIGFKPIGYMESCWKEKKGTPRQGSVSLTSRGKITLLFGTNPKHTLTGLSEYSHVWVLWLFHDNGNKGLKALVHPPRLDGERQGIFATRSPHRPNAIGLSLCRLEQIEDATVHLSCVDIIHGTPILDIKPYLPHFDGTGDQETKVPRWIQDSPVPVLSVRFSTEADEQLEALQSTFTFFTSVAEAKSTIEDVLKWDPRSVHLRKDVDFTSASGKRFVFGVDSVDVSACFDAAVATVVEVVPIFSKLHKRAKEGDSAE